MKVLKIGWWYYGHDSCRLGGLSAQVTKLEHDGVIFYVRENSNGIPSFNISSGERWGDKRGAKPSLGRQVLEICCPPSRFEQFAALVQQLDSMKRKVKINKLFTSEWAEENLNR